MDSEQDQLELPSTGTVLETPGQQCPPNGETGRTTADGYLLVGMGSNQGGDTSPPTERVDTRAGTATTPANSSNTIFLKASRKPEDKKKGSEENTQFDPGGKQATTLERGSNGVVFFPGGNFGPWEARCLCFVFSVCVRLCVCFLYCSIR